MRGLLVLLALRGAPTFATCNQALRELTLTRTHTLRDAWWPVLDEIGRRVHALPPDTIRARAEALRLKVYAAEPSREARRVFNEARLRGVPFDRMFIGQFALGVNQVVGHSRDNKKTMRQLLRAMAVLDSFLTDWETDLQATPSFAQARDFLKRFSFSGPKVGDGLADGNLTVLQAASWLTADAVAGMSDGELLRATLVSCDRRVTPVVQLALGAPAGLLGRYATYVYTRHPLVPGPDGRLRLSAHLRQFLSDAPDEPWSLGHGCPAGFRSPGASTSGLQAYLDALVTVLDALAIIT